MSFTTAADLNLALFQDLNQLSLGDMTGADAFVDEEGEEDVHISDSESDLVSLASDLDEDDLAEIEEKEKQLKKLPKKKCVAQTATFYIIKVVFGINAL